MTVTAQSITFTCICASLETESCLHGVIATAVEQGENLLKISASSWITLSSGGGRGKRIFSSFFQEKELQADKLLKKQSNLLLIYQKILSILLLYIGIWNLAGFSTTFTGSQRSMQKLLQKCSAIISRISESSCAIQWIYRHKRFQFY